MSDASDASLLARLYASNHAKVLSRQAVTPFDQQKCPAIVTPLLPHQLVNVGFMMERERDLYASIVGGFLLDDFGLGKSLSVIALIAESLRSVDPTQLTLIVGTKNVVCQWEREIQDHLKYKTLNCVIYYDNALVRHEIADNIRRYPDSHGYNVVITTYGRVRKEFDKSAHTFYENSLFRQTFDRIVLDEAHNIRNRAAEQTKAVCELSGERRWCVTATPLWNKVEDYYPLMSFLRIYPLAEWKYFQRNICHEIEHRPRFAFDLICEVLAQCAVRHAKDEIPQLRDIKRHHEQVKLTLNAVERSFNNSLAQRTCAEIGFLVRIHDWLQRFGNVNDLSGAVRFRVLSMITRLRQAADSMELVPETSDTDLQKRCAVCLDFQCEYVLEPCNHLLCSRCLISLRGSSDSSVEAAESFEECPFCHDELKDFHLFQEAAKASSAADPQLLLHTLNNPSSKTAWILNLLKDGIKTVIMSPFVSYLDLLQRHIEHNYPGKVVLRIDGSVSATQRLRRQARFTTDPNIQVFLCSLTAGGQGSNLQVAPRVVITGPWWNQEVMQQGSNRVDRIGQESPDVYVYWLHARDTVEDLIYKMADKKHKVALTTLLGTSHNTNNMHWAARIKLMIEQLPLAYRDRIDENQAASSSDRKLPASFFQK